MSTITKERIANLLQFNSEGSDCQANAEQWEVHELARIALASLEAEPVAYADPQAFRNFQAGVASREWMWANPDAGLIPLHTAPPAPVYVPDEDLLHMAASAIEDLLSNKDRSGAGVWTDVPARLRRAAMLQGAEPVSNRDELPDGWVACSERMPDEAGDIIVVSDGIVMSGVSYSRKKGFYLQALEYDADELVDDVTHWMTLPAAPQQGVKP